MGSLLHVPVRIRNDRARVRMLCRNPEYEAGLIYYIPGTQQASHVHDRAQLSFLLCGGFLEEGEAREAMPLGSRHAYKPGGAEHRVDFGWSGALILSIDFFEGSPLGSAPTDWCPNSAFLARWMRLLFERIADPEEVLSDLIATVSLKADAACATRTPPRWVRLAAEQIVDDPTAEIGDVAAAAGVHRVHLSRSFQKHFGQTPTHYRLQAKAAHALHYLIERGASPGEAAAAAGFADQSHWNRTSRAIGGYAPARLGRMLAA